LKRAEYQVLIGFRLRNAWACVFLAEEILPIILRRLRWNLTTF
jgi:hypothetical protein